MSAARSLASASSVRAHAWAIRGDGDGVLTEREPRRLRDHRAVDAAAECDRDCFQIAKHGQKPVALDCQLGSQDHSFHRGSIRHQHQNCAQMGGGFTVRTGQGDSRMIRSAWLPRMRWARPVRP